MDLNMIKGLGPTFRQTMYKNGVFDVEQLIKILPSKIEFCEPVDFDSITKSGNTTLEVTILTYIEPVGDDEERLHFTVSCGREVKATVKSNPSIKKQLIPGKKIKIYGFFNLEEDSIEIETIFDINDKIFKTFYEVGDLPSSQIKNFSEKGLHILTDFSKEIPDYIKEKLGVVSYSSILQDIHMPKSCDGFVRAIKNYTYEIFFNFFTSYYYYVLSTTTPRNENEKLDPIKINAAISLFGDFATIEKKKNLNEILKEFKKPFYTNLLLENYSNEDKKLAVITSIITKVSMKKQVVIITKENFELYTSMKEDLASLNIKVDVMARKGRNKENFTQFNTGKFDVLITPPVNFETLETKDVGLVICDSEIFDFSKRYSLNCNNTDTIFLTQTKLTSKIDKQILKNISVINLDEEEKTLKEIIFTNFLSNPNYGIIDELLNDDDIRDIIVRSSYDSYDFIKNKRFKEDKKSFDYFKKLMNELTEQPVLKNK